MGQNYRLEIGTGDGYELSAVDDCQVFWSWGYWEAVERARLIYWTSPLRAQHRSARLLDEASQVVWVQAVGDHRHAA